MTRPWSLERRLVLVLGGVLSLLWLIATVATLALTRQEIGEVFDSGLQETAQRLMPLAVHDLKEAAEHNDGDDDGESLSEEFDDSDAYLTYQVRNAAGRVLLRSHDAPVEGFSAPLVRGFATVDHLRIYTEASRDGRFFVQVAETGARRDMLIRQALVWLIIPLAALILAAVIAVTLIVRSATRPVLRLQEEIRSRDGANLAPLPEHPLPNELQPIVDAVNRLLARLQRAIAAERSFTAHSAHELRTPIAAAQAQAQLLFDAARSPAERQRARNLLDLLSRLGRLVEKLLQLSRAEAGVGSAGSSDLREVTGLVIDEYRHRLTGGSSPVEIHEDGTPAERIAIDPDALGIVLHNLIDNAITHGRRAATSARALRARGDRSRGIRPRSLHRRCHHARGWRIAHDPFTCLGARRWLRSRSVVPGTEIEKLRGSKGSERPMAPCPTGHASRLHIGLAAHPALPAACHQVLQY
jgi:two-component system OmpR family sensor kinase